MAAVAAVCPYGIIRTNRKTFAVQRVGWFVLILFPLKTALKWSLQEGGEKPRRHLKDNSFRSLRRLPCCNALDKLLHTVCAGLLHSLPHVSVYIQLKAATGGIKNGQEKYSKWISEKLYHALLDKAAKKGRTRSEVDEIVCWLTGYSAEELEQALSSPSAMAASSATPPLPTPTGR